MRVGKENPALPGFNHLTFTTAALWDRKYTPLLRIDNITMSIMNVRSEFDRAGITTLTAYSCSHRMLPVF